MTGELVTTAQAAALLGVRPHTLRCWRMRGVGPAYLRFGGPRSRALYTRDAIVAWLGEHTWRSTAEEAAAAEEGSNVLP